MRSNIFISLLIINIKLNKNNIDTDYTNEANPFKIYLNGIDLRH
jgi:hypothetical protein